MESNGPLPSVRRSFENNKNRRVERDGEIEKQVQSLVSNLNVLEEECYQQPTNPISSFPSPAVPLLQTLSLLVTQKSIIVKQFNCQREATGEGVVTRIGNEQEVEEAR